MINVIACAGDRYFHFEIEDTTENRDLIQMAAGEVCIRSNQPPNCNKLDKLLEGGKEVGVTGIGLFDGPTFIYRQEW